MKILVTGGAGFIGSHVVDHLVAAGHEVAVIDDLSTGRASNLHPSAKFYQLDIRSPEVREVFEVERPEVLNHHAAQIDARRSVSEPLFDAEVNILGSIQLFEAAKDFGVRKIVYASSGGAIYGEPKHLPCDESHPVQPINPYGVAKYTTEVYLRLYHANHGIDFSILRYANVYGPRQDPLGEGGVIAIFAGQMLKDAPVKIYGSGDQVRDFLYVADCARANMMLLDRGAGKAYNFATGIATSVNEIYDRLKAITGYHQPAQFAPPIAQEIQKSCLDASLVQKELGWEPEVGLEQGLARTVEYFRKEELHLGRAT